MWPAMSWRWQPAGRILSIPWARRFRGACNPVRPRHSRPAPASALAPRAGVGRRNRVRETYPGRSFFLFRCNRLDSHAFAQEVGRVGDHLFLLVETGDDLDLLAEISAQGHLE